MTYTKPLPLPQLKTQTNVINIYHWITETQAFAMFLVELHLNRISQPINLKKDYWLVHSYRNCPDLKQAFSWSQDCYPRSTCVGDVMEMNGRYYLVMPHDFQEITPEL